VFRHDDVLALNQRLAALAPKLADTLATALNTTLQLRVYRYLLGEHVSLRDIVPIATSLLESVELTRDPIMLAADVRCVLKRQICQAVLGARSELRAFNLTGELENLLLGSLSQAQQSGKVMLDSFAVDPNMLAQLQVNMPIIREQMKQMGVPPVLLVMPQIRPILARYAKLFASGLTVLSYNEIADNREVSIVGTLG